MNAHSHPEPDVLVRRLTMLGQQMIRMAGEVAQRRGGAMANVHTALGEDSALLGLLAEEVYRNRARREHFLPAHLFGEPAWDLMLDLFAAAASGRRVSVSAACAAARAPTSTALRWLNHLEDAGLVDRVPDPSDARRSYVALSAAGLAAMGAYFADVRGDLADPGAMAPMAAAVRSG